VETYLQDQRTLMEQRQFFSEAFSTGDASQFISRDQDRWLYNAFMCIKAAGEQTYSASEYPLHYCKALDYCEELHYCKALDYCEELHYYKELH
uniref:CX9C domain-containing protein n=1 Tax=Globodera pallida TaxID=36090 RepID=A0A183CTK6_GLOPA